MLECWVLLEANPETDVVADAVNASKSSIEENAWLVLCWGQLYNPTGESKLGTSYLFLYGEAVLEAVVEDVAGLRGSPTCASKNKQKTIVELMKFFWNWFHEKQKSFKNVIYLCQDFVEMLDIVYFCRKICSVRLEHILMVFEDYSVGCYSFF